MLLHRLSSLLRLDGSAADIVVERQEPLLCSEYDAGRSELL
jgi:hypothetical protein